MPKSRARRIICSLTSLAGAGAVAAQADDAPITGFAVQTYASGLNEPVALEFAPDGRLFVAELGGTVRVVVDGEVDAQIIARIDVYHENENGLLGLALDPQFDRNGFIYLFATIDTREQRILRVTEPRRRAAGESDTPVVIRDHLPTMGVFHSGGGLKFGPDGMLYFAIGDNLVAENAQDMNTLAGKICRISSDGGTPSDNPFRTTSGAARAIWALGFRNPFRFCFAPDGRMFALDVGSDDSARREEINLVRAGKNYGWPLVEGTKGDTLNTDFVDPIYDYHDGGAAPVGAVYYTGKQFAPEFRENLFHLEYVLGRLYRTVLDGDRVVSHTTFVQGSGGPVDLTQGPDGALYYSELHTGAIKRVYSLVDWSESVTNPTSGAVAGETAENLSVSANPCATGWIFGFAGSLVGLAGMRRRNSARAARGYSSASQVATRL